MSAKRAPSPAPQGLQRVIAQTYEERPRLAQSRILNVTKEHNAQLSNPRSQSEQLLRTWTIRTGPT